ncbi:hypothetical protein Purlil1_6935 [Purpureocillium lilacinum]|uniref:Uncharacterized protein n=1 Tax=Purpureocillium lilacinum TaxID=33203 RepID=A0ABR0BXA8_PURLI|nr:hypothetical protein Purlil1_6935 [Purpureocillium lilacinum]
MLPGAPSCDASLIRIGGLPILLIACTYALLELVLRCTAPAERTDPAHLGVPLGAARTQASGHSGTGERPLFLPAGTWTLDGTAARRRGQQGNLHSPPTVFSSRRQGRHPPWAPVCAHPGTQGTPISIHYHHQHHHRPPPAQRPWPGWLASAQSRSSPPKTRSGTGRPQHQRQQVPRSAGTRFGEAPGPKKQKFYSKNPKNAKNNPRPSFAALLALPFAEPALTPSPPPPNHHHHTHLPYLPYLPYLDLSPSALLSPLQPRLPASPPTPNPSPSRIARPPRLASSLPPAVQSRVVPVQAQSVRFSLVPAALPERGPVFPRATAITNPLPTSLLPRLASSCGPAESLGSANLPADRVENVAS